MHVSTCELLQVKWYNRWQETPTTSSTVRTHLGPEIESIRWLDVVEMIPKRHVVDAKAQHAVSSEQLQATRPRLIIFRQRSGQVTHLCTNSVSKSAQVFSAMATFELATKPAFMHVITYIARVSSKQRLSVSVQPAQQL